MKTLLLIGMFIVVRILLLTAITLIVIAVALTSTLCLSVEIVSRRHDRELASNVTERPLYQDIIRRLSLVYNLTKTLLDRYSGELDQSIIAILSRIQSSIERADIESLNQSLIALSKLLEENSELYLTLSEEARSLLSLLASHKVSLEGNEVKVVLNSNTLLTLTSLLNVSTSELDIVETVNALLELASLTKDIDPSYSKLLVELANTLMRNDYYTASKLYTTVYSRLGEVLSELLSKGYISSEELNEILRKLPTSITSSGKLVKMESDTLKQLFDMGEVKEETITPARLEKQIQTGIGRLPNLGNIGIPTLVTPSLKVIPQVNITSILPIVIIVLVVVVLPLLKPVRSIIRKCVSDVKTFITIKRLESMMSVNLHPVIRYYLLALEVMRRKGIPKYSYETPREYLSRLRSRFEYSIFKSMTYIYEKVKYGNKPVGLEEVDVCRRGYEEISRRLERR
ncbi:MAG TPA: DUF4129 domain-containing protein [Desulfurococcales archaeon]|nr:DUF4129 domain-containing protein [Desulfurococcales archaeon]